MVTSIIRILPDSSLTDKHNTALEDLLNISFAYLEIIFSSSFFNIE